MGNRELVDIIVVANRVSLEDREEEVNRIAESVSTSAEFKEELQKANLSIHREQYNTDVVGWLYGDCDKESYCIYKDLKACEDKCTQLEKIVYDTNTCMGEYLTALIGDDNNKVGMNSIGYKEKIGNSIVWNNLVTSKKGTLTEYMIFIYKWDKSKVYKA